MAKAVSTYLGENIQIISGIAELNENLNRLNDICDRIEFKDAERKTIRMGKSSFKESLKIMVTKRALAVAGAVHAYSIFAKETELREKSRLNKSQLAKFRSAELISRLTNIRDLAAVHISSLSPYGMDQQKLDNFTLLISRYEQSLGQMESSLAIQKGGMGTLKELFRELNDTLTSTDNLTNNLTEEYPEFVRTYRNTRRIYNQGIRHREKKEIKIVEEVMSKQS